MSPEILIPRRVCLPPWLPIGAWTSRGLSPIGRISAVLSVILGGFVCPRVGPFGPYLEGASPPHSRGGMSVARGVAFGLQLIGGLAAGVYRYQAGSGGVPWAEFLWAMAWVTTS